MSLPINIFTVLYTILSLVSSKETFLYEKQNFYGLGRRLMPRPQKILINMDNKEAYPAPLPSSTYPAVANLIPSPYKTIYQGIRIKNDTRVFRRRFDYDAKFHGHQVLCEAMFDCLVTFLAVESTEATPVILRGGVGYRHFTVVVKAKAGKELKGQIRAYCKKQDQEDEYSGLVLKTNFKTRHKKE